MIFELNHFYAHPKLGSHCIKVVDIALQCDEFSDIEVEIYERYLNGSPRLVKAIDIQKLRVDGSEYNHWYCLYH